VHGLCFDRLITVNVGFGSSRAESAPLRWCCPKTRLVAVPSALTVKRGH